jgi:hypothetical protein
MIAVAIGLCEVAFWVFLVAGLSARYLLRRPRVGLVLLLGAPAADVALLGLTAGDLHRGAPATQAHALAAAYLGFSVAFGHDVIAAADRWAARRVGGRPAEVSRPRTPAERAAREWREFAKAALAWAITVATLLALTALAGGPSEAEPLLGYVVTVSIVLVVWFAWVRCRQASPRPGRWDAAAIMTSGGPASADVKVLVSSATTRPESSCRQGRRPGTRTSPGSSVSSVDQAARVGAASSAVTKAAVDDCAVPAQLP